MRIRHWSCIVLLVLLITSWLFPVFPDTGPAPFQHQVAFANTSALGAVSPPYTSGHDPAPGQTAVPVNTSIVLNVSDDEEGVDLSTLVLKVDGIKVNPAITGTPASYTLSYKPPENFDFSQTVSITVEAADLAGNGMSPYTYYFATEASMPQVDEQLPAPGETGVSISSDISARVLATGCGVDIASLRMKVNGIPVPISISGTPTAYTINHSPAHSFRYSEVVQVSIDAANLTGGVMETVTYHFATMPAPDTAPPYITERIPEPGQTGVPIDTNIVLNVVDDGHGVDITSLSMQVQGHNVDFLISGTPAQYTLSYSPPVKFCFSELVTVSVDAADLKGNAMPRVSYTFATEHDDTAPYISWKSPASGEELVGVDSSIVIQVRDDGAGVNVNSIHMTVQGLPVTPVITETSATYTLIYTPATPFPYAKTVDVSLEAADLAGNVMAAISYTFMTRPDTSPPYVTGQDPGPGTINVPVHSSIVLHIKDSGVGVDVSSISMRVNGTLASPTIGGSPDHYQLFYNPPLDFYFGQVVKVRIEASDLAGNAMSPVSYTFTTKPDTTLPQAAAISPVAGQTEVPIDSSIIATITDYGSGVDMATIEMEVDGVKVKPVLTGSPAAYTLTYNIPVPFQYSKVITVVIRASDMAGNTMAPFSYSFATEPDIHPPYVADASPIPGSIGVCTAAVLSVNLLDSGEGISIDSIRMLVNGVPVTPEVTGTPAHYVVTHAPEGGFRYSSIVNISVTASDLSGNQMDAYSYSFTTRPDTTPPYVTALVPAPDSKDVSMNSSIFLHVLDDGDGVDASSIQMKLDGLPVVPTLASITNGFAITYNRPDGWDYQQTVLVSIDAADIAGNVMPTYTYSFTSEREPDTTPPVVSGMSPVPNEEQVAPDRLVVIHVADAGDGVDVDSIEIIMNSTNVSPEISGSPADYKLTFPLPDDSGLGLEVDITIAASDLAGNVMTPVSYSFTMKPDDVPPFTAKHAPAPDSFEIPLDTQIVVHVQDLLPGVDEDTIVMLINGIEVAPSITGSKEDYKLTYTPDAAFGHFELVEVVIKASDLAGNAMAPYEYSFITESGPVTLPERPVNISPEPEKTGVSLTPRLIASEFSHSKDSAKHMASWWEVILIPEEGEPETVFDSGVDGENLTEVQLAEIELEPATTYHWRVRYSDGSSWSDWSEETAFTTGGTSLPLWIWIVGGLGVFLFIGVTAVLVLRRFDALPEWLPWLGEE